MTNFKPVSPDYKPTATDYLNPEAPAAPFKFTIKKDDVDKASYVPSIKEMLASQKKGSEGKGLSEKTYKEVMEDFNQ